LPDKLPAPNKLALALSNRTSLKTKTVNS